MRKFEFVKYNDISETPAKQLPKRATAHSIAYDFYSPIDIIIPPKCSYLIWTNIKAKFKPNEALLLNVRSSMGSKNIMLVNTQAWIESDYYNNQTNDGNIGVNLYNYGNAEYHISKGDRIAQGMFIKYLITSNDKTKEKRKGGFGSSGK